MDRVGEGARSQRARLEALRSFEDVPAVVGARCADIDFLERGRANIADVKSAEIAIEAGPEGLRRPSAQISGATPGMLTKGLSEGIV